MKYDKDIIKSLMALVEDYNQDGIAKECIIGVFSSNNKDESIVVKITTKGEANKNTPFYFASLYTTIIAEHWKGREMVWADMLYWNNNSQEI